MLGRIRSGLIILAFSTPYSHTQVPYTLASEPHTFAGIVVEDLGKPVSGASLDHTDDGKDHLTDADGRFTLTTRAPAVVVRKPGFRSERIATAHPIDVPIVLHPTALPQALPSCHDVKTFAGLEGWDSKLRLPKVDSFVASKQINDADYGQRIYWLKHSKKNRPAISQGSGVMWSFGHPMNEFVWASTSYSEVDYIVEGRPVIDARGEFADGRFWRTLSRFGESIDYLTSDQMAARQFDSLIDAVCLVSGK